MSNCLVWVVWPGLQCSHVSRGNCAPCYSCCNNIVLSTCWDFSGDVTLQPTYSGWHSLPCPIWNWKLETVRHCGLHSQPYQLWAWCSHMRLCHKQKVTVGFTTMSATDWLQRPGSNLTAVWHHDAQFKDKRQAKLPAGTLRRSGDEDSCWVVDWLGLELSSD